MDYRVMEFKFLVRMKKINIEKKKIYVVSDDVTDYI